MIIQIYLCVLCVSVVKDFKKNDPDAVAEKL